MEKVQKKNKRALTLWRSQLWKVDVTFSSSSKQYKTLAFLIWLLSYKTKWPSKVSKTMSLMN